MAFDSKAVLIVHLCDLHVRNDQSDAVRRLENLSGAIGSSIDEPTLVILAFSGDLAYSGKQAEYAVVRNAVERLSGELKRWSVTDVLTICAPGNHDCDFDVTPQGVRTALVAGLADPKNEPAEFVKLLRQTQSAFNDFTHDVATVPAVDCGPIVSRIDLQVNDLKLRFLVLNTSITSQLHERAGSLRMPPKALPVIDGDSGFCVALAHHPLNWFDPQDAAPLSEWFDRSADLVLLGHEHRLDEFEQVRRRNGSRVAYEIGLPLDDAAADSRGVLCRKILLSTREAWAYKVLFHGSAPDASEISAVPLEHNDGRCSDHPRLSAEFSAFLKDPGAAFTHPRVNRELALDDIIVSRDFRKLRSKRSFDADDESVEAMCKHLTDEGVRAVVFGPEQAGKTTFAKRLTRHALSADHVPVYLDGAAVQNTSSGQLRGWYNGAVRREFATESHPRVDMCPPGRRIAIVDNTHMIRGGQAAVALVVDFLSQKCGSVVLLTADNPAMSFISATDTEDSTYWKGSDVFELMPLGNRRRGELIRRWVSLGRDPVGDGASIEAEMRQVKRVLDRILGRDALPKFPIFILMLLQQIEGLRENRTVAANGSHGYLFQALISQAIDKYVRSHEIGTVSNYLSSIAHDLWSRDNEFLTMTEVDLITRSFFDRLVRIDQRTLLEELDAGRILFIRDGVVGFRYKYVYYYYLAVWICDRASDAESDAALDRLAALIHTEFASNVLMFVAHLGQESRVVKRLVPLLESLHSTRSDTLSTLEEHSALLVTFRTAEQRAVLLDGEARTVSNVTLESEDAERERGADNAARREVDDVLRINTTLKAISTLGQVLKSRATSLSPEAKIRIADTVFSAARRLMNFLYKVTSDQAAEIVKVVSDAFERSFRVDRQKAVDAANELIGVVVVAIADVCICRAGEAVSSAELSPLLDRLEARATADGKQDLELMVLVGRISGDRSYPKERVEDYVNMIKRANVLARSVLGHAVARRFYLDPPSRSVRDSACRLLGIEVRRTAIGRRQ